MRGEKKNDETICGYRSRYFYDVTNRLRYIRSTAGYRDHNHNYHSRGHNCSDRDHRTGG